ncbi:MAG: 4a-hydroxytetrahydrobiopterin dehydratase [Pseudomonadota bacterium]
MPEMDEQAIGAALEKCPDWQRDGTKIIRELRFEDFATAFAFMTQCAMVFEKYDHHPDWQNSYNRIRISLTTHSCKGLSDKDFICAAAIDIIISKLR